MLAASLTAARTRTKLKMSRSWRCGRPGAVGVIRIGRGENSIYEAGCLLTKRAGACKTVVTSRAPKTNSPEMGVAGKTYAEPASLVDDVTDGHDAVMA